MYINNNYFKKNINEITSTNDPTIIFNGLLGARNVLVCLPHNVGSGMVLSCREFGLV